ncbi:MAG: prepilin peptidase [Candidatus Yonathbacteria bacterium]|nr:prepilin peptidase [Candidatus Yonathbacteria bacterium]
MDFLILVPVFILGTIIGSFLNVVIYRYNSGLSPLKGRSQCFACGKILHWYELIPIVSFIIERGRCANCRVKLSWQYPVVEIFSGIIFVVVYVLGKTLPETIYLLVIFSTLLVIAVYDLRHKIIPDGLVAFFAVLSLVWFLWTTGVSRVFYFPHYWTLIAGPLLFFPFVALWVISKGKWLGLGDGKLALGIGWFLGSALGGSAIMLAFWIGAGFALCAMGAQRAKPEFIKFVKFIKSIKSNTNVPTFNFMNFKNFTNGAVSHFSLKSEIPFGPFLILGVFIVYFTKVNFFDGSINLFSLL